jgi:hypothetical protein
MYPVRTYPVSYRIQLQTWRYFHFDDFFGGLKLYRPPLVNADEAMIAALDPIAREGWEALPHDFGY